MRTPIFAIAFFFVALFLYVKLAGPVPFSVNSVSTTKTNLFSATGTGKATAVPNTALLYLGVTKTSPTVLDAQNQVNTIANNLVSDLKSLGVEEKNIKTTNYSVSPDYDYSQGKQTAKGYTVTQSMEVRIKPIEKANSAIDAATKNGANMVGSITFILDDETKKELQNKARKDAVKDAKEKAESLANAAGLRLGRIIDVQENGGYQPFTERIMMAAPGGGETDTKTELNPGENTIETTVTLSYETY